MFLHRLQRLNKWPELMIATLPETCQREGHRVKQAFADHVNALTEALLPLKDWACAFPALIWNNPLGPAPLLLC